MNFEFSAAYFEESKYDECIEWCQKAVEVGRETRADYKLISKAMARAGSAFQKKDDLNEAVNWYGKAVSEHRDPVIDSTNKKYLVKFIFLPLPLKLDEFYRKRLKFCMISRPCESAKRESIILSSPTLP